MTASVRFVIGAALAILLSALFPVEVYAQKVAIVHGDIPLRADAVKAKLVTAGVTDVTIINAGAGSAPTLSDLEQYQAVLTWSMGGYADSAALGDALADYADQGGGVVQAVFSFDPGMGLAGRWDSDAYGVFSSATAEVLEPLSFTLLQPSHDIVSSATFAHGGIAFVCPSFVQDGSDLIAEWENGYPLIATRTGPHGGRIVGLNLYPFLGEAGPWMANALRFVAGEAWVPVDGPSVALLAAGGSTAGASDVRRKLRDLRVFSRIDTINAASTIPTLDSLRQYDAVMTWSSSTYANPSALGDVLAAYVDDNRGVVEAAFSNDPAASQHLDGRWASDGYRPLTLGATSTAAGPLTLLPVVPGHPLLSGVSSFNGGTSSFHSAAGLGAATTLVASWSNGDPLAAYGTKGPGRVVGLNMYPPSSDAQSGLWDSSTDGARLMANALLLAANHFPTASAGDDQSAAATSSAGVSFTLNATAADLDGDPLSFDWSGAVSATGQSIVVDVPPPPAPNKSHTLTLTLTVADGKGGETTDSVDLTVTDMVAPVLHDMPVGTISVESANGTDATVSYGPVTATDAVDGDVAVTCSHSGAFPIGDTLVTCSASDSRANSTSASFTVRVTRAVDPEPEPEPGAPGRMSGRGFMREEGRIFEFVMSARENAAGAERGGLFVAVKPANNSAHRGRRRGHFESISVSAVTFSPDSSVVFAGTGRWNGNAGYRYEVTAADTRGGGRSHDRVSITITSPSGQVVVHCEGALDGGNIFIRKFSN